MMGERRVDQSALFYEFSLERHVPADHMLRAIDVPPSAPTHPASIPPAAIPSP